MTVIEVPSINDVVRQGKLVDLTNDYRTARIVRSSLPDKSSYAMTAAAFRQHLQQISGEEMQSRVDALCASLNDALRRVGQPTTTDFEYRFFGGDRKPQSSPLKLQWFGPNKYWVILLPDEDIRQMDDPPGPGGSASAASSPH
jgi:hypothetical protein